MASELNQTGKSKLWALAVLCLLRERDMHPYEMRLLMRQRHKEERLLLKAGSLYHAIGWLEQLGLIQALGTSQQGKRPVRTVYHLTQTGQQELLNWLRELISTPAREASSFAVALDHAIHLPPKEVAEQLEKRATLLEPRLQEMDYVLKVLAPQIGRINLLEVELERALCQAELAWMQQTVRDLRSGALTWDIAQILGYLRSAAVNEDKKPTVV